MPVSVVPYYYQYGTPISGIMFPLQTASGTLVTTTTLSGYLSGSISINGNTWSALGYTRMSALPGAGVWCVTSLSSTETATYSWAIRLASRSGCDPVVIVGTCVSADWATQASVSGMAGLTTNVSNIGLNMSGHALKMDVSSLAGTLVAISGLKNDVSGLPGLATNVSTIGLNMSGHALRTDVSALPGILTAVSGTAIAASGSDKILTAISGLKNDISGIPGISTNTSAIGLGISGLATLNSVSSVAGGVGAVKTDDGSVLISGTLAHDARLLRWYHWDNRVVDKRYDPVQEFVWNGTNMSTYFTIQDDSNTTQRSKV